LTVRGGILVVGGQSHAEPIRGQDFGLAGAGALTSRVCE